MANLPNETLQLARRAAQECRALRSLINNNQPTNEALQTSTKGALVDAINELADRPVANATTVATVIGAATSKASPELNDQLALTDSSAAGALRRISWSQLRTALKSYLDAFYSTLPWSSITSKPSTFPPSEHTHSSGDVIDATSTDVPETIVKRDTYGGAIIKWLTIPAGAGGIVFDSGGGITSSILAYNDGSITSAAEFSLPIGTGFGCLTSDPGGVPDNLYPSDPAGVRWNLGIGSAGDSIFQAVDFSGYGSVRYMLGLDIDQVPFFYGLAIGSPWGPGNVSVYGYYASGGVDYSSFDISPSSNGDTYLWISAGGNGIKGRLYVDGVPIGKGSGTVQSNIAIGYETLLVNASGSLNTALGYQALRSSTGSSNTATGYQALYTASSGTENSAFGRQALRSSTTATRNTAVGCSSAYSTSTGSYNTAVGFESLNLNTTGSNNVAIGHLTLRSNNASNNTAAGHQALYNNTSGANNVAIGALAGQYISGGSTANTISANSVFIGAETKALASNQTNQIVIGYGVTGGGSNTTTIGSASTIQTILAGTIKSPVYTVATLPVAATTSGQRSFVSDATATTFASVVAGGGSNFVPVYSDGTSWRIG